MSNEVRSAEIRVSANVAAGIRGVRQLGDEFEKTGKQAERAGQRGGQSLEKLGSMGGKVALAGGLVLGVMERTNILFDKQMSAVQAATGAQGAQLESLRAAAVKAGADTAFSASEAAQGITELGKAGQSTADILGGGLKGALDLAAAGQINVGDAAEFMATALTQFHLKGDKAAHVADLLAAGAGKAQGEVQDMALALSYVGVPAAQAGVSIEETAGTIALLAKNGIIGEKAGTSLRGMMASLTAPSQVAEKTMKKLGISVFDTKGEFVGFDGVAYQLHNRLGNLTEQERLNALGRIFGNEQLQAANVLYEQGARGVHEWTKKVNDSGFAARTAATKTDNLAGDLERLKGSLDSVFLGQGGGFQGGLRDVVQTAERLVDKFGELPAGVQSAVVKALALATAIGGALFVAGKIAKTFREIRDITGGAKLAKGGGLGGAAAKATGVVPVYVTNMGAGLPGAGGPGKGVPPVGVPTKPGSVPKVTGIGGLLTGLAFTGATVGAIGNEKLPPLKPIPFGMSASEYKEYEARKKTAALAKEQQQTQKSTNELLLQGVDATGKMAVKATAVQLAAEKTKTAQEQSKLGVNKLLAPLEQYKAQVASLPKAVQTEIKTNGLPKSKADIIDLAKKYNLTPKQIKTLAKLSDQTAPTRAEVTRKVKALSRVVGVPRIRLDPGNTLAQAGSLWSSLAGIFNRPIVQQVFTVKAPGAASGKRAGAVAGAEGMMLATVRRYAYGDIANGHQPEFAGPGVTRVWREEETGGESYIPHANDHRRPRAKAITQATAALMGGTVTWHATGSTTTSGHKGLTQIKVGAYGPFTVTTLDVANAQRIAVLAKQTAREQRLEDFRAQQSIRDLQRQLAEKQRGKYVLTGLDRKIALEELAAARDALKEIRTQAQAIALAKSEAATTLTGQLDIFSRGTGARGAVASVDAMVSDISTYGQTAARLKAAGASPALLSLIASKAESGDFRSAIRLGKALLASPATLGQLNASLSTLGQVSAQTAGITADPRFLAAGAWNPTSVAPATVKKVDVTLGADPNAWMNELVRQVTFQVKAEMAGGL